MHAGVADSDGELGKLVEVLRATVVGEGDVNGDGDDVHIKGLGS